MTGLPQGPFQETRRGQKNKRRGAKFCAPTYAPAY
jgi:hypothetical protein